MLDLILGSKTAQKIFLHLYHHGESYPSAVAKDMKISLGAVQKQFERFESAGIIISTLQGRTRLYRFNMKNGAVVTHFKAMVKIVYTSISLKEKRKIFSVRRRPRRTGKPILGRGK
ncbi:MAG: winged helix-turn-helix domain-containing protein [Bacteriovoracales bacterium]|nr:winged helix-turn-helix domain-containing protein [Bacteriovoracales bacterium]